MKKKRSGGGELPQNQLDTYTIRFEGGVPAHLTINIVRATPEKDCVGERVELLNGYDRKELKRYVQAGLLREDYGPAEGLSRGEKALLAHDIAERLGKSQFWSTFEDDWGLRGMKTDYCKFMKTAKSVKLLKVLSALK